MMVTMIDNYARVYTPVKTNLTPTNGSHTYGGNDD